MNGHSTQNLILNSWRTTCFSQSDILLFVLIRGDAYVSWPYVFIKSDLLPLDAPKLAKAVLLSGAEVRAARPDHAIAVPITFFHCDKSLTPTAIASLLPRLLVNSILSTFFNVL